jgi:autotransporter-associated beta strand protein
MFELWLDDSRANGGAIRAAAGQSVLTGPIALTGDLIVRAELNSQVTLVGNLANLNPWFVTVTFQGTYANAPQITMIADGTNLTGINASVNVATTTIGTATTDAVQTITFGGTVTGGSFTLAFNNGTTTSTTLPILYSSNLATLTANIQTALDALLGSGNTAELAVVPTNHWALIKSGPGTLVLAGTNSYGGGTLTNDTFVKEGVLAVQNRFALGASTSGTVVSKGAALQMQSDISGEPLTLNGNGIPLNGHNTGALRSTTNINVYSGPITLATDSTIGVDSGSQLTITGTIQDGAAPAIPPGGGPDREAGAVATAHQLTKELTGTLILDPFAVTVTFQGTLANAPQITMAPDGTLLTGVNATVNVATTTIGTATADAVQTITFGGTVTGGSFTLTFNNGTTSTTTAAITYDPNLATLAANIQTALDTLLGATKTLEAGAGNTYKGGTVVEQGVLNIRKPLALGTVTYGTTSATVATGGGGSGYTVGQVLTVTGGVNTQPTQLTVTATGAGGAVTAVQVTQNGAYTVLPPNPVSVDVPGGATFNLTSVAPGTQVQDGAQLQIQGGITVMNQPLQLSGTGIFGTGALLNAGGNNTWQGPITLTSITVNLPPVTLPVPGIAIGVSNAADTLTINGKIDESAPANGITDFGIQKVGPGTVILQKQDVYTGLTEVSAGTLTIQDPRALGTPGGPPINGTQVDAGATLALDLLGASSQTVSGETLTLNGAGVNGVGALDNISGFNTWAAAPIVLNTNSAIGVDAGALTVTGGINDPSPLPPAPATLSKVGVGTMFLPTANNYQGLTQVQNGVLSVSHAGALGASGTSEVQTVTSTSLAGSFSLAFNGFSTPTSGPGWLPYNASGLAVQNALNLLPSISGSVGGSVSVNLTGTSDVQTVTVTGTSGTFKLTFKGQQTGALAFNVPATGGVLPTDSLQNALQALSLIGAGNVSVTLVGTVYTITFTGALRFFNEPQMTATFTGGDSVVVATQTPGTGVYNITFNGPLAGFPQPLMTVGAGTTAAIAVARTTAGTGGTAVLTTNASQTVTVTGTTGTFRVSFNGQLTGALAFNVPASGGTGPTASLQNALQALPNIGAGNVTVTGPVGGVYTVTFIGALAGLPQNQLMPGALTGTAAVTVATTTVGISGTLQLEAGAAAYANETLELSGPGFMGMGALDSATGSNTWDSPVLLVGNASIGADSNNIPATLAVHQTISELTPGSSLTKVGVGNVSFNGTTSNIYTGLTTVSDGTLQLNKSGGAIAIAANVLVGDAPDVDAATDLDTLQLLQSSQINPLSTVSIVSDGNFDLNSQTQTIAALNMVGGQVSLNGAPSVLTLNGTVIAAADASGNPATVNGPGTLALTALTGSFVVNGPGSGNEDMQINAVITGSVGLTKSGPGILQLTNHEQYAGITTIAQGTLLADDPAVGVNTVNAVSLSGGTLAGVGQVGSIVSAVAGGTVSPGDTPTSPGTITSGPVTWNGATTYNLIIDSPTSFSLLTVNGPVDLGSAALNATLGAGYTPSIGNSFVIMTATGTISNTFATTQTGFVFVAGMKFSIVIDNSPVTGPNTVTVTRVKASTVTTIVSDHNPSVYGQIVTFTATVAPETGATGIPLGTVNFFIDSSPTPVNAAPIMLVNGQATFKTSSLAMPLTVSGSPHTVNVVFTDTDALFTGSDSISAPVLQTITKAPTTTTVTSSANPSVFGQLVTFTATISALPASPAAPTGTVNFLIDSVVVARNVSLNTSGVATYTTPTALALTNGTPHTVFVVYTNSDGNFTSGSSSLPGGQIVNKADTTITVATTNATAVYGEPIITATVFAKSPGVGTPTGNVTFSINNGTTIVTEIDALSGSDVATLRQVLVPGAYTITATYAGDLDFNNNLTSNSLAQTISKDGATVTVSSSANPGIYGQAVTFSASIVGVAPGGTAPGSQSATGSADLIIDSGPAIATATVSAGVVSFTPTAAIAQALTFINGSTHQVQVVYHGDANYIGNNNLLPGGQAINKATTTAAISTSVNPTVFGQPVTFSAVITPQFALGGAPGGTASLYIDDPSTTTPKFANVSVVNGAVAFPAIADLSLTPGAPHLVKVVYNGDGASGNFQAGSNAILTPGQTVKQASSTTSITADVATSVYGQVVTFTAIVQGRAPSTGAVPKGTVVFFIDNNQANATPITLDSTGAATFKTSSLATPLPVSGAPHTVSVTYTTDSSNDFLPSSATLTGGETVKKASTTTTVVSSAPGSGPYGAASITATVAPVSPGAGAPSGNAVFTVTIGSTVTTETDALQTVGASQVATLRQVLTPGTYTVSAAYQGDANFLGGSGVLTGGQIVTKSATTVAVVSSVNPSAFGQPVTFSATISAVSPGGTMTGSALPGGTATLTIDSTQVYTNIPVVNGAISFTQTTTNLTVAGSPHSVTVTYNGDANYTVNGGTLSGGQIVAKASTSVLVASSANPSVYGQPVTFSATISAVSPGFGSPGGTADLFVDSFDVQPNVAVSAGSVSFAAISSLSIAGSPHLVQVVYNGDGANFAGNNAFLAGGQTVTQSPTTTSVTSSSSTSTYGQRVTFTATVAASASGAGTPTGTVNFYDGTIDIGHKLGTGTLGQANPDVATYQTTSLQLTGGPHSIIAVYQADSNFVTSQGSVAQTVLKVGTSTTDVSTNNAGAVYGQLITLSATVSEAAGVGTPTGTINFYDGVVNPTDLIASGTVNGSGTASITVPSASPLLPALGAGDHTLTAVYQGDVNFFTSTSLAPQTVQHVNKASSGTVISTDTANAVYGQETITATVSDTTASSSGTPTGTVNFTIVNGSSTVIQPVTLVNGVATLTAPANVFTGLSAGNSSVTYSISAAYTGDINFTTSASAGSIGQKVSQAGSTTQLTANPTGSSVAGQSVTFTAVVTPTSPGAGLPTGTVKFFDGATQIGTTQTLALMGTQEQASIVVSNLAVGSTAHTISAVYAGDSNFITSTSATTSLSVGMASTTTAFSSSAPTTTYGQPVTFTATVAVSNPGSGTATGSVSFYDGSVAPAKLLGTGALNQNAGSDQATFTTTAQQLAGGSHTIIAVYQGDSNFIISQSQNTTVNQTVQQDSTTTVLSSSKASPIVGRPFTVTATVTSVPSGLNITGGTVTFTVDSTTSSPVAVSGGQASITVTFSTGGNHTISALYSGDTNFFGSSASSLVVGVLTPNQGYVAQAYRDLFHREVDAGGLAYWSGRLDNGTITRVQFALGLDTSPEYHADAVQALFVHYLHRNADGGSVSFFAGLMNQGTTEEQIAAMLAGSDEYYNNRGSGTVDGFLNALYSDTLNRAVDPGARQSFTQSLSFHVSRQQVATIVLGSYEYKSDIVAGFYTEFLHRTTDAQGQNFWATKMTQGLTDEQFIALLVGSDEYYNNSI